MRRALKLRYGVRQEAGQLHDQMGGMSLDRVETLESALKAPLDLLEGGGMAGKGVARAAAFPAPALGRVAQHLTGADMGEGRDHVLDHDERAQEIEADRAVLGVRLDPGPRLLVRQRPGEAADEPGDQLS